MSHKRFGDQPHPTPQPASPTSFGEHLKFSRILFTSSFQQPRRSVLHLFTWRSSRLYMLDYGRRAVYRLWIRIKGNLRTLMWRDINLTQDSFKSVEAWVVSLSRSSAHRVIGFKWDKVAGRYPIFLSWASYYWTWIFPKIKVFSSPKIEIYYLVRCRRSIWRRRRESLRHCQLAILLKSLLGR